MARLASHVWVGAYLTRLNGEGIFAHVMHKGDPTAGAVVVKCANLAGVASLFTRNYRADGTLGWDGDLLDVPEGQVDDAIARARRRDPDLWVVEVEDPRGRHMLFEV
ncbi:MAG: DUF1491 family protein [Pseudomonadota bacterium]